MCDVEMVVTPTGDHTCTELLATQPAWTAVIVVRVYSFLGIRNIWCRAKPLVIVESLRYRHRSRISTCRVSRETHLDGLKLTDSTVTYKFAGYAELCH
jgi:hypothetical protein